MNHSPCHALQPPRSSPRSSTGCSQALLKASLLRRWDKVTWLGVQAQVWLRIGRWGNSPGPDSSDSLWGHGSCPSSPVFGVLSPQEREEKSLPAHAYRAEISPQHHRHEGFSVGHLDLLIHTYRYVHMEIHMPTRAMKDCFQT